MELETINEITGRIDGTTQAVKNWCVGIWAGSIALSVNAEREQLVYFTAILPLLFWFVDAWWRRIQRSFIFRSRKISEFLNSERLAQSFERQELVGFSVLDPKGTQYEDSGEYRDFTSVLRTARFRDVGVFYIGLSLVSIFAGIVANNGT